MTISSLAALEARLADYPAIAGRVRFGVGALGGLGSALREVVPSGAKLLLVVDPALLPLGLADRARAAARDAGYEVVTFAGFASDPKAEQVDCAAVLARETGAKAVVGLGGGSALDLAKLAAAAAVAEAPSAAYALMATALPEAPLPLIAVPTTSGTGSEVTRTSVYTLADGAKVWAWGEALRPARVVLDPELTVSLPPAVTVITGVDALVHAIEAATNRRARPESDRPALEAIALIVAALPAALARGSDLEARGALMAAACLAGLAIDQVGTGVAHALGHALGALAGVPHGRAVGLSLAVALADNATAAPERHAAVAGAFGLPAGRGLALAYAAFLERVGMSRNLAD
ncbi:MAG: iron-containing alcohol dehydrogenase, partial [Kiloniellales bacterium]